MQRPDTNSILQLKYKLKGRCGNNTQELTATVQEAMGSPWKELKEISRAEIEDKRRHN